MLFETENQVVSRGFAFQTTFRHRIIHFASFVLVVSNLKIKLTRAYSIGSHCILGVKHTD